MSRRALFRPACQEIGRWLKANGFGLGALTGTDIRALHAAVHLLELYAIDRDDCVIAAFGIAAGQMQPGTRYIAYHAIAYVLDWADRDPIWNAAGLPAVSDVDRVFAGRKIYESDATKGTAVAL